MAMGELFGSLCAKPLPARDHSSGKQDVSCGERCGEEERVLGDRSAHGDRRQTGGRVGVEVCGTEFQVVSAATRGFDPGREFGRAVFPDFRDRDGYRAEEQLEDGDGVMAEAAVAFARVRG
jgi:hypothetical protein